MGKVIPANIPRHREVEDKFRRLIDEAYLALKSKRGTASLKVDPVYLSPEQARQYERFTGHPYDAEAIARTKSWCAFKAVNHRLLRDAAA